MYCLCSELALYYIVRGMVLQLWSLREIDLVLGVIYYTIYYIEAVLPAGNNRNPPMSKACSPRIE